MHELVELKEMLMKELEEYGSKGELTAGTLDVVDKLAHTVKNLCKIMEESEYSERSYSRGSYARGGRGGSYDYSMDGSYYEGGSYARGRGSNARRDSRGRYARDGEEISQKLRELMEDAPDEKTRVEIQKLISKIDNM